MLRLHAFPRSSRTMLQLMLVLQTEFLIYSIILARISLLLLSLEMGLMKLSLTNCPLSLRLFNTDFLDAIHMTGMMLLTIQALIFRFFDSMFAT